MNLHKHLKEAERIARRVPGVLQARGLAPHFTDWLLIGDSGEVWLFGVLDVSRIERLERYIHPDVLHQVSTVLRGKPVCVSNSSGLRYGILLSRPRALPAHAPLDLAARPGMPYAVGVGVGHAGPIWAPLPALGHVMVSGSTGSGKSYFLRALVHQLISLPASQPVALYLADRAGNVFTPLGAYRVPQLVGEVAKTPEAVVEMLDAAVEEMGRRERLFDAETGHFPDKLEEYNRIAGVTPLPRAAVVVDEVTVLVEETGGERGHVHRALLALAAQGRKYGFTVIVAGQDFKATTFNTALTHQLSTRVAFKAGSAAESRVVLGVEGAERLRGKGHGLLRHGGKLVAFQGFAVEKAALIAQCQAIGTEPEPGPTLSDWERNLIRYALAELDGAFSQNRLYDAFGGDVSKHTIRKLSDDWLACGWLVEERRGGDIGARRWVTPTLAALARKPVNAVNVGQRTG